LARVLGENSPIPGHHTARPALPCPHFSTIFTYRARFQQIGWYPGTFCTYNLSMLWMFQRAHNMPSDIMLCTPNTHLTAFTLNLPVFMWPSLPLFSSLYKARWKWSCGHASSRPNLGPVPLLCINFKTILQKPHDHYGEGITKVMMALGASLLVECTIAT
jgi:hypothetical protein